MLDAPALDGSQAQYSSMAIPTAGGGATLACPITLGEHRDAGRCGTVGRLSWREWHATRATPQLRGSGRLAHRSHGLSMVHVLQASPARHMGR